MCRVQGLTPVIMLSALPQLEVGRLSDSVFVKLGIVSRRQIRSTLLEGAAATA